jgi:hypothetical protein
VLSVDSADSADAAAPKPVSERVLSVDSVAEVAELFEKNPLVMVCSLSSVRSVAGDGAFVCVGDMRRGRCEKFPSSSRFSQMHPLPQVNPG